MNRTMMIGIVGAAAGVAFAEFTAARAQVCYARRIMKSDSPANSLKRLALDGAGSEGIVLPQFGKYYRPAAGATVAMVVVGIGFAL